jgi:transcriptional regulator with XRE-family HTH domain
LSPVGSHTVGMSGSDADELREALREHLEMRGWSVNAWAQKAGIREGTLRNFLAGRSETVTYDTLVALARASGIKVSNFLRGRSVGSASVPVLYETSMTEWRSLTPSNFNNDEIDLPIDRRYPQADRFGVIVGDNSFDLTYKKGSILVCAKYTTLKRSPAAGDRVFCEERKTSNTSNIEQKINKPNTNSFDQARYSIRQIVEDEGSWWLTLRSFSPRWQDSIELPRILKSKPNNCEDFFDVNQRSFMLRGVVISSFNFE